MMKAAMAIARVSMRPPSPFGGQVKPADLATGARPPCTAQPIAGIGPAAAPDWVVGVPAKQPIVYGKVSVM